MNNLLTPQQLSEILQIKPSTVYKWAHYGYIPYIKVGSLIRFNEKKIIEWLNKRQRRGRTSYRLKISTNHPL